MPGPVRKWDVMALPQANQLWAWRDPVSGSRRQLQLPVDRLDFIHRSDAAALDRPGR